MSREPIRALNVEERIDLIEDASANGCTLDGQPAYVSGYRLPFAKVHRKGSHGDGVEFAWPTVQRILSTHRNFQS